MQAYKQYACTNKKDMTSLTDNLHHRMAVLVAICEIYIIIYKHREIDACEYGHILTADTYIISV